MKWARAEDPKTPVGSISWRGYYVQQMKLIQSGVLQLLVLTAAMVTSVGFGLSGSNVMGWQNILAIVLLLTCWSLRKFNPAWFKAGLLITLLAASLEVAIFLPVRVLIGFTWTVANYPLNIGFNPFFGPIFLYTLWIWRDPVRSFIKGPPSGSQERERAYRASVDSYKRRLNQNASEDLHHRLRQPDGLVPEARVAVEEILTERGER